MKISEGNAIYLNADGANNVYYVFESNELTFYVEGNTPIALTSTGVKFERGFTNGVHQINAESTENNNLITGYYNTVLVSGAVSDADDFIVLPAIATVEIGHQIQIFCSAGGAFEMRTPSTSNTTINNLDCDGSTYEYLCTDTEVITVTKRTATGWVATAISKLGTRVVAVVPHVI